LHLSDFLGNQLKFKANAENAIKVYFIDFSAFDALA
jgi:hypothetical protein